MKLGTLAAAFAVAFTLGGVAIADDCCKGGDKAPAKNDGCCEGEKAAAKKDDGCCKEGDKAAAKNDAKKDECKDSKESCGAGETCGVTLESKPATYAVKITGMTCGSCSTAISGKIKSIEGVSKVDVCHEAGMAKIEVAAGKSVCVLGLEKALPEKFKLDESAKLGGVIRLTIAGAESHETMKGFCGKLAGLKIMAKADCGFDAAKKTATFTFVACDKGSEVSVKAIKALFEGEKSLKLAGLELVGAMPQKAAEKSKT